MQKIDLKKLAKSKGLTLYELADLLKVSRQQVYNWQQKKNIPSPSKIRKLAEVFNVKMIDLLLYFYEEEGNEQYLFENH